MCQASATFLLMMMKFETFFPRLKSRLAKQSGKSSSDVKNNKKKKNVTRFNNLEGANTGKEELSSRCVVLNLLVYTWPQAKFRSTSHVSGRLLAGLNCNFTNFRCVKVRYQAITERSVSF